MGRVVAVVGLMGAGKSTLGRALAARLGLRFRDSDADIEAMTGRSARDIAATDGMAELHRLEREVLLDALKGEEVVVAAAAAALDTADTVDALDQAFVVWPDTTPEVLAARFLSRPGRPVYGEALEVLRGHDVRRRPALTAVADIVVDATEPTPAQVDQVVEALSQALPGTSPTTSPRTTTRD